LSVDVSDVMNLTDLERLAEAQLPPMAWDYYASGADDELTLRRNVAAWRELALHYRVLVDVSTRDLRTTVLGQPVSMPILVAPTAFHRLAHPDGELASVQGAGDAGTAFVLSTLSTTRVEDVLAAAAGPVWFQLYVYKDRGATEALVRRVEVAQRLAERAGSSVDPRAIAEKVLPGAVGDATRTAISRAESPAEGLAMLLVSPEFVRR
jgi:4-hydroxymandelate oxidase